MYLETVENVKKNVEEFENDQHGCIKRRCEIMDLCIYVIVGPKNYALLKDSILSSLISNLLHSIY